MEFVMSLGDIKKVKDMDTKESREDERIDSLVKEVTDLLEEEVHPGADSN
jgi:hypothetical protein